MTRRRVASQILSETWRTGERPRPRLNTANIIPRAWPQKGHKRWVRVYASLSSLSHLFEALGDGFLPADHGVVALGHQLEDAVFLEHAAEVDVESLLDHAIRVPEGTALRLLPARSENAVIYNR